MTSEGKPLQCDAENGGKDKKAYLLVPKHLIPTVQLQLNHYLQIIRQVQFSLSRDDNNPYQNDGRPDEIYVPTAAVQRNIDFIKSMASVDIWKNAPSTIRQANSNGTTKANTHTTTHNGNWTTSTTRNINHTGTPPRNNNPTQPRTPLSDNLSAISGGNHMNNYTTRNQGHPSGNRNRDDNTITTCQTNTTTSNSNYAIKFAEIDQAIKASQQEFLNLNTRFDEMETSMINTMASCHENSKHMLAMQTQMNTMQTNVQEIATQMKLLMTHLTTTTPPEQAPRSPEKKKQRHSEPNTERNEPNLATDNRKYTNVLKECEDTNTEVEMNHEEVDNTNINDNASQEGAQYTIQCSPDMAMKE
jgi:hypothetical protein